MFTVRAVFYLSISFGIFLLSILTGYYPFLILMLPFISLLFFSFILSPSLNLEDVEIQRDVSSTRIFVGEDINVKIRIKNNSIRKYFIEVSDAVPNYSIVKDGLSKTILTLEPGSVFTLNYKLNFPRRGHYDIGPLEIVAFDYLKIRFKKYTVGRSITVSVFPRFIDLKGFTVSPKKTGVWPGTITSRKSGQGLEFYGIREYKVGDEMRRINWKAYARLQKLVTNEFESERVTDILIIVDTSGGEVLGNYAFTLLESEVNAAASLSWLFLKYGNRVGVIVHGRYRGWIKPHFGKKQFLRIMHFLADVSLGGVISLDYLLKNLLPLLLKPKTQIILITPLLDSNIISVVQYALLNNYNIMVITPSVYYLLLDSSDRKERIIGHLLKIKKENMIMQVGRLCPIIEWNVETSLDNVLKYAKVTLRLFAR